MTANYNRKQRPNSTGAPVDVQIEIYLTSLTEVSQTEQKLGAAGYFRVWWTDTRLAYPSIADGGCFDRVNLMKADIAKIWQPDLYFDNVLDESYGADLFQVYPSGSIWRSTFVNHEYSCSMDFRKLPFDTQQCTIRVGTYSEDSTQVVVSPRKNLGVVLPEVKPEPTVWEIDKVEGVTEFFPTQTGRKWALAVLKVTLDRKPDYYMRGIVLKALLFVIISWCGFFVNRQMAPARVAIGVIPVLIMINLHTAAEGLLPPVSYTTTLANYLMTCLIFVSTAVLEYAIVAYLLQSEIWHAEKFAALLKIGSSKLKKTTGEPSVEDPPGTSAPRDSQTTTSGAPPAEASAGTSGVQNSAATSGEPAREISPGTSDLKLEDTTVNPSSPPISEQPKKWSWVWGWCGVSEQPGTGTSDLKLKGRWDTTLEPAPPPVSEQPGTERTSGTSDLKPGPATLEAPAPPASEQPGASDVKHQDRTTSAEALSEQPPSLDQQQSGSQTNKSWKEKLSGGTRDHLYQNRAVLFDNHPVIVEIFKEFDKSRNGHYSVKEIRKGFRGFGIYRSRREVKEMFQRLGVAEGEDMTLSQFERFIADPNQYLPVTSTIRSFWDLSRSLQLDIFMRWAYPIVFCLITLIHASSLA